MYEAIYWELNPLLLHIQIWCFFFIIFFFFNLIYFDVLYFFHYHLVLLYSVSPAITTPLSMSMSPFSFLLNPSIPLTTPTPVVILLSLYESAPIFLVSSVYSLDVSCQLIYAILLSIFLSTFVLDVYVVYRYIILVCVWWEKVWCEGEHV